MSTKQDVLGPTDFRFGLDMKEFKSKLTEDSTRRSLVFMARQAEIAERYDDMCKFMRALVEWANDHGKVDLVVEERNLLSVAYKNVIGSRRASWRTLNVEENKEDDLIKEYKKQVEIELEAICKDVLHLLVNYLLKNCTEDGEARVFYLKMTGDYYRYLAEFIPKQGYDQLAADMYQQATTIATLKLPTTHPIRLGLALNYSVCFYEILRDKSRACNLAKTAFDQAISKLDQLDEASYKDSTLIMQLLRDNLTLWTSDSETAPGAQDSTEDPAQAQQS